MRANPFLTGFWTGQNGLQVENPNPARAFLVGWAGWARIAIPNSSSRVHPSLHVQDSNTATPVVLSECPWVRFGLSATMQSVILGSLIKIGRMKILKINQM